MRKTQQRKRNEGATGWLILPTGSEENPASFYSMFKKGWWLIETASTASLLLFCTSPEIACEMNCCPLEFQSPHLFHGGILKPPNWLPKFPSACNFPKVHSEVLRWSVSPGERKLRAAAKGASSTLSLRLSSRHFTRKPIETGSRPRPVTWRQSCGRGTLATDKI